MSSAKMEKRIKNHEIIKQMYDEGATIEEMAEATGYKEITVYEVVRQIRLDMAQNEHLTYADHPRPMIPLVMVEGKPYWDITDLFLSSEWEGR